MTTIFINKNDIKRKYYLMDAKGKILGRLAVQVALLLSGKRKSNYTPNVDNGDFVVVVNAAKVAVTGAKLEQKVYTHYTGYPSGLKTKNLKTLLRTRPTEVIRHAVKGMLPKNKLGSRMITRLKLYAGGEHPHKAQDPQKIEV
ncbi:MAG: 50S ribosomal protein L13 [Candidatus Omnitrophica bacterium]|nr:50S ribosomal protein L13 [Candidatus Omnitrophota bacterium]MBU4457816.1 50S ribosomal protein L13 [Candidatus Omnitrophota bacterium]